MLLSLFYAEWRLTVPREPPRPQAALWRLGGLATAERDESGKATGPNGAGGRPGTAPIMPSTPGHLEKKLKRLNGPNLRLTCKGTRKQTPGRLKRIAHCGPKGVSRHVFGLHCKEANDANFPHDRISQERRC